MNNVTILGASGSIGSSALSFLRLHRDAFHLTNVAFQRNWQAALAIVAEFGCRAVSFDDVEAARHFKDAWHGPSCDVLDGPDAACALAREPVHTVLAAISGSAGFASVLAAVRAGNRVALANKEALVCGGHRLVACAAEYGRAIVPVDSEHSAIFQCLLAGRRRDIAGLVLTASGGPFRDWSETEIAAATPADALRHPTWSMGPKNTLDSASLANKGLELIEAAYLFGVDESLIQVVVHPTSLFHSAVQYADGAMVAMLGEADMRNAIGYGFTYPDRRPTGVPLLDLARVGRLDFHPVDARRFPCLDLARQAFRAGAGGTLMFNAANEEAGRLFLAGAIGFSDIARIIGRALERDLAAFDVDLDSVIDADAAAKRMVRESALR